MEEIVKSPKSDKTKPTESDATKSPKKGETEEMKDLSLLLPLFAQTIEIGQTDGFIGIIKYLTEKKKKDETFMTSKTSILLINELLVNAFEYLLHNFL